MTYAEHAEKNWDWMMGVGYISDEWNVYDGANVEHNCTNINKAQYSYNAGVLIQGLAFMYNNVSLLTPCGSRILGLRSLSRRGEGLASCCICPC